MNATQALRVRQWAEQIRSTPVTKIDMSLYWNDYACAGCLVGHARHNSDFRAQGLWSEAAISRNWGDFRAELGEFFGLTAAQLFDLQFGDGGQVGLLPSDWRSSYSSSLRSPAQHADLLLSFIPPELAAELVDPILIKENA